MSTFVREHGEEQDVRLTDEERKLVARLLSDPTYFPVEFRTWLKNYIESAGINVTASQIRGGTRLRTGLPPGLLLPCAAPGAVPPDALACDGRGLSRTVYNQLFQKIGTTWGAGDGSTTFNLPDLRDRTLFGIGAAVGAGATDGQAYGSRGGPRHQHSASADPHQHTFGREVVGLTPGEWTYNILGNLATHDVATDVAGVGIHVGPGGTLTDAPNWAGVVWAITTGKTA